MQMGKNSAGHISFQDEPAEYFMQLLSWLSEEPRRELVQCSALELSTSNRNPEWDFPDWAMPEVC
jgi:hypothetical protein